MYRCPERCLKIPTSSPRKRSGRRALIGAMIEVAFPRNAEFERTLAGLKLGTTETNTVGPVLPVSRACQAITSSGQREFHPQLLLNFPADGISPAALVKAVLRQLRKKGHVVNEQACAALLGLIALDPTLSQDPVATANDILEKQTAADLSQFVILRDPLPRTWTDLQMGPFTLGALEKERLRRRCEKAGSDFHELYSPQLIHGFA